MRPGISHRPSPPPTAAVWRRSSATATALRSMSGGPRSCCLTADGLGTVEIMRRTGKSKTCVWRWQERFAARGRRRPVARQDPALARSAARAGGHRQGGGADRDRAAARGDALDGRRHGQGGRHQRLLGAAHLEGARPRAAPHAPLQALERSRLRAQAARRRRPLCRSAGPCGGAVGRREEPDPGARPHPARPAPEEGPRRHHDARLQAPRHHHAVRRPQRARRHRHRPLHAAPPAPGVHPLPQRHRGGGRRPARSSTSSSTTTPPTSSRR